MRDLKKLPAYFYVTDLGREPVREWLLELNSEDRRIIGQDIMTLEFGWPLGMPLCRKLSPGLWEVRSSITKNRIARVIFTLMNDKMVLLHGFVKKSQKTPIQDLSIAKQRRKEIK